MKGKVIVIGEATKKQKKKKTVKRKSQTRLQLRSNLQTQWGLVIFLFEFLQQWRSIKMLVFLFSFILKFFKMC